MITDRTNRSKLLKNTPLFTIQTATSYHQLFRSSPAVSLIIDPDTRAIVDANQSAVDFYGYSLDEFKNLKIFQINTAPPAEIYRLMAAVRSNYYRAIPFTHMLKDGTTRAVDVYSGPFLAEEKVLLVSIVIDVTAQKQAEAALEESRERLSLVVEGAKAGIWDLDLVSGEVYQDAQWAAMLGYEADEVAHDKAIWQNSWHPEDVPKIQAAMDKYLAGETDKYEIDYRLRAKDGTYRHILTYGKLSRDESNRPVRWTGANIDITDTKRTEQLYLESAKRLREYAETLSDASFVIDEEGRFLEVFGDHKLLPAPKEAMIGRMVKDVLSMNDAAFVLSEVNKALLTGKPQMNSHEFAIGSNKRHVHGRMVPLSYRVDGKRTVAVTVTDTTEQRRTEQILQRTYELRQISDLMSDIIAGRANSASIPYLSGKIGFDLMQPSFTMKILSDRFICNDAGTSDVQKFKDEMIFLLNEEEPGCLAWNGCEGIAVIAAASLGQAEIARRIADKLVTFHDGMAASIGISEINSGLDGLKISCQQALAAALAARCSNSTALLHYKDAGIFQLVPGLLATGATKDYVTRQIGPLIEYDLTRNTNYLVTLEELLKGTSVREVAEKQYLHPKTIVSRQKTIAKILDFRFEDYQRKLAIAMAIQLHKLGR